MVDLDFLVLILLLLLLIDFHWDDSIVDFSFPFFFLLFIPFVIEKQKERLVKDDLP